jgi:acetyl esterase/lipase
VHIEKAIVFAERDGFRALEIDVYQPDGERSADRPLVLYVHGGGWRVSHRSRAPRETRQWRKGFFERVTDAGFVVAACDYRLSGEATFPAQLDDVTDAVRWLHGHAAELGADPARVALWGASAGGHLAALAALAPEAPPVIGVVAWYPITDLLALDQSATDTFEAQLLGGPIGGDVERARAASPVAHVHAGAPPFLLQHGDADSWVPFTQSVRLAGALVAVGARVQLEIVPGADHFFDGGADVDAIFGRAVAFLHGLLAI